MELTKILRRATMPILASGILISAYTLQTTRHENNPAETTPAKIQTETKPPVRQTIKAIEDKQYFTLSKQIYSLGEDITWQFKKTGKPVHLGAIRVSPKENVTLYPFTEQDITHKVNVEGIDIPISRNPARTSLKGTLKLEDAANIGPHTIYVALEESGNITAYKTTFLVEKR